MTDQERVKTLLGPLCLVQVVNPDFHCDQLLTMFAEGPAKHVPGPPPLASGVRHDAR